MNYTFTVFGLLYFIVGVLGVSLLFIVWSRRHVPAAKSFLLLILSASLSAFSSGFEAFAVPLSLKLLWTKFSYLANNGLVLGLILFALKFTLPDWKHTAFKITALSLLPVLHTIMSFLNPFHGLIWTGISPGEAGTNLVVYEHSWYFWVIMLTFIAYAAAATILFVRCAVIRGKVYRGQSIIVLLAAAMPWTGAILYFTDNTVFPGIDTTTLSFFLSGLLFFFALFRGGFLDILPVARERIIESMKDGILVIDPSYRIVDFNPALKDLFGNPSNLNYGKSSKSLLGKMYSIHPDVNPEDVIEGEMAIRGREGIYLEMQSADVNTRYGRKLGRVLVFRNITQKKKIEIALHNANRNLKHRIDEIHTLHEKLKEQALRDSLTGLYNRRYIEESIPKEIDRAERMKYSICFVMIDLDYFKMLNDNYGHHTGDIVLKKIGTLLDAQTRKGDLACRYGGEEFLLILPALTSNTAYRRICEIQEAFSASCQENNTNRDLIEKEVPPRTRNFPYCSFSAGISMFPEHGKSAREFIRYADQAMYTAKRAGRNRVCIWEEEKAV